MDTLLIRVIDLMHQAQDDETLFSGHDKKKCVLHGAAKLVEDLGIELDPVFFDMFIDTVCVLARNKDMLKPLSLSWAKSCFK